MGLLSRPRVSTSTASVSAVTWPSSRRTCSVSSVVPWSAGGESADMFMSASMPACAGTGQGLCHQVQAGASRPEDPWLASVSSRGGTQRRAWSGRSARAQATPSASSCPQPGTASGWPAGWWTGTALLGAAGGKEGAPFYVGSPSRAFLSITPRGLARGQGRRPSRSLCSASAQAAARALAGVAAAAAARAAGQAPAPAPVQVLAGAVAAVGVPAVPAMVGAGPRRRRRVRRPRPRRRGAGPALVPVVRAVQVPAAPKRTEAITARRRSWVGCP